MTKQQGRIIITFLLRSGFLLALLLFAASLLPRAVGQPQIGRKRLIDAQARWVWQNPLPQGNTLYSVSFTSASTGTATGDNGTIVRTTDGGNSWVIQSSGTTNTLYGVSFTDINHGTAVGAAGTVVGRRMAVTPGPVKRVERPMASWPVRLSIQTQELQLGRME